MLYYYQLFVERIQIVTSYLRVTNQSNWEKHYQKFEQEYQLQSKKNFSLTIFICLHVFSLFLPFLRLIPELNIWSTASFIFLGVFIFFFIVYSVLLFSCFRNNEEFETEWRKVLKIKDEDEDEE